MQQITEGQEEGGWGSKSESSLTKVGISFQTQVGISGETFNLTLTTACQCDCGEPQINSQQVSSFISFDGSSLYENVPLFTKSPAPNFCFFTQPNDMVSQQSRWIISTVSIKSSSQNAGYYFHNAVLSPDVLAFTYIVFSVMELDL